MSTDNKYSLLLKTLLDMDKEDMNETQKKLVNSLEDHKISVENLMVYLNDNKTFEGTPIEFEGKPLSLTDLDLQIPEGFSLEDLDPQTIIDLGKGWKMTIAGIDLGKGWRRG